MQTVRQGAQKNPFSSVRWERAQSDAALETVRRLQRLDLTCHVYAGLCHVILRYHDLLPHR